MKPLEGGWVTMDFMPHWSRFLAICVATLALLGCTQAPPPAAETKQPEPQLALTAEGKTFEHDGVKLYYEVYGSGEPLLLIHCNGCTGAIFKAEIEHFAPKYQVIVMDSRDQGRSADSPDKLTYEKMADDQAALLDHLKVGPANVVGWSDGGIEALLLGIRHPDKVKKIVAMAANLKPSGLQPEAIKWINDSVAELRKTADKDPAAKRNLKVTEMMLHEPQIESKALEAIKVPALILASDHDLILDEHTLDIYHHIPKAQLNIFSDAVHSIPVDNPTRFVEPIDHFLANEYKLHDRMGEVLKAFETAPQPPAQK